MRAIKAADGETAPPHQTREETMSVDSKDPAVIRKIFAAYSVREDGLLIRKTKRNKYLIGDVAGWLDDRGYRSVNLEGKSYKVHRLVWLLTYGSWPNGEIDHINGIRSDNRVSNL